MEIDRVSVKRLQEKVFAFYSENGRSFPWRETTDRYAIYVSEIMLQQTQAERVVARYRAWLERFPDIHALAGARLRDVLSSWSGLGYNARAQRMHRCAGIIVREYGGVVPSSPESLVTLPGIGFYTSRSIPIFADNLDIATIDTNIRRILIHELGLCDKGLSQAELLSLAVKLLPKGRSRQWHNALMDYGALFLTGRKTGIRPLTRQTKFRDSRRWYRGRIIKELVDNDVMHLEEFQERYGDGVAGILDDLEKEGLVERFACDNERVVYKIPG